MGRLFHNHLPRSKIVIRGAFCLLPMLCPSSLLFLTSSSTGAVTGPRKKPKAEISVCAEHIPSAPALSQGVRGAGQMGCCGMVPPLCCAMVKCNIVMNNNSENYCAGGRWGRGTVSCNWCQGFAFCPVLQSPSFTSAGCPVSYEATDVTGE